jgi:hypothetical protein
MRKIRKAVFPVAGLGTRFLPATKAMPKEMLTVVDRPLIQHVVDEARAAGIEHFIFVTGRNKGVIEDHFDRQFELESTLRERGKKTELELLERDLPGAGAMSFIRQQSPLGLGHAVWCAREIAGNEPFALLLPDVLVQAKKSCLAQMIEAYAALGENANLIAVEEVPEDRTHMYGVVGMGKRKGAAFAPTASSPAATSCSPRSSSSSRKRSAAPAARSSSPTPCSGSQKSSPSTASTSRAAPSIAARRSAFCPPTSPMRWRAKIWLRLSAPNYNRSSLENERETGLPFYR